MTHTPDSNHSPLSIFSESMTSSCGGAIARAEALYLRLTSSPFSEDPLFSYSQITELLGDMIDDLKVLESCNYGWHEAGYQEEQLLIEIEGQRTALGAAIQNTLKRCYTNQQRGLLWDCLEFLNPETARVAPSPLSSSSSPLLTGSPADGGFTPTPLRDGGEYGGDDREHSRARSILNSAASLPEWKTPDLGQQEDENPGVVRHVPPKEYTRHQPLGNITNMNNNNNNNNNNLSIAPKQKQQQQLQLQKQQNYMDPRSQQQQPLPHHSNQQLEQQTLPVRRPAPVALHKYADLDTGVPLNPYSLAAFPTPLAKPEPRALPLVNLDDIDEETQKQVIKRGRARETEVNSSTNSTATTHYHHHHHHNEDGVRKKGGGYNSSSSSSFHKERNLGKTLGRRFFSLITIPVRLFVNRFTVKLGVSAAAVVAVGHHLPALQTATETTTRQLVTTIYPWTQQQSRAVGGTVRAKIVSLGKRWTPQNNNKGEEKRTVEESDGEEEDIRMDTNVVKRPPPQVLVGRG